MAGYSDKSLAQKLGYQAGMQVCLLNAPETYTQELHPVLLQTQVKEKLDGSFDLIHLFVKEKNELEKIFPDLVAHLNDKGMIWISWPKKAAKVETDIDENIVREIGLQLGVVDVKVCAVDEVWSGLKFLRRKTSA